MTTFADRYRHWSPEPETTDSDPYDYDQYQAWANAQPAPAPIAARPVFTPDPSFQFQAPLRPCGVLGRLLAVCGDCFRCPDRTSPGQGAR